MRETMINHPKLRVVHETGAEGPHHDPYHYDEFTVISSKGEVVLHLGALWDWAELNGKKVELKGFTDKERVQFLRNDFLKSATGYSLDQIERIARRRSSRCPRCGGREFSSVAGFPGEYLYVCDSCGEIVGSHFNESEVI